MKYVAIACAFVLFTAATAAAGDLAVSKSALGSMGLGSMQLLSDNEGQAIRGKGTFAGVTGSSHASWLVSNGPSLQESTNNYESGAQWIGKGSSAGGHSLSFAAKVNVLFAHDPTGSALQVSVVGGIAGGGANAWAH
ncbi:MAG TPA: hypothetical protein VFW87_20885 [Pirellulales bacterium]|nr:hypothetical protein [Pirellulales bacterium]